MKESQNFSSWAMSPWAILIYRYLEYMRQEWKTEFAHQMTNSGRQIVIDIQRWSSIFPAGEGLTGTVEAARGKLHMDLEKHKSHSIPPPPLHALHECISQTSTNPQSGSLARGPTVLQCWHKRLKSALHVLGRGWLTWWAGQKGNLPLMCRYYQCPSTMDTIPMWQTLWENTLMAYTFLNHIEFLCMK